MRNVYRWAKRERRKEDIRMREVWSSTTGTLVAVKDYSVWKKGGGAGASLCTFLATDDREAKAKHRMHYPDSCREQYLTTFEDGKMRKVS